MSWPLVKLAELMSDIQPGFASGKNLEEGTLQVRMNNVKPDGSWDWSKKRIVPATDKQKEKYSLTVGDILFNATNSAEQVGKSALYSTEIEETVCFSNHFLRLRTINEKLLPEYLIRYLAYLWQIRVFENMVDAWVNQATVRREDFLNLQIPLPPLEEQKRIAEILDKADSVRRKRQQAIDLADDFLRSVFLDMFGDPNVDDNRWESLTIGEIGGNENSKRVPLKQADRDLREGPFPYYGATGIIDHLDSYIFDGSYLLIAEDGKNLINRTKPLAFPAKGKFWVNNHAHVLSDTGRINLIYLEYFLNFKDIRSHVTGIDQFKLNRTSLDRIKVFNPSMKLQKKFESIVMKTKSTQCDAVIALKESHNCFNSLSQKAFAGEL